MRIGGTRWALAALTFLTLLAGSEASHAAPTTSAASSGAFRLVTYNVAGLPEGISSSRPSANMPLIGKLLAEYDLVLVQEDFAYGRELRASLALPHASPPFSGGRTLHVGDGLSQFSRLPFKDFTRQAWSACYGLLDAWCDCLAQKGFSYSRQMLATGVFVDVYDVHLDAGDGEGDTNARRAQIAQLAAAIERSSRDAAVIVAGDTNIPHSQRPELEVLLEQASLRDSCSELRCTTPGLVDRVLYRSSPSLLLEPKSHRVDRRFVDAKGEPLSDHPAVAVEFTWVVPQGSARISRSPRSAAPTRTGSPKAKAAQGTAAANPASRTRRQ